MKHKIWLNTAFFQFVIIAIIGLMMRLIFLGKDVGFAYKNLLHAHSHVSFLGWVSLAMFVGLINLFAAQEEHTKVFHRILLLIEISIIGMLISFPIQGYGLYSISFSTLFLIGSYWFSAKFYKIIKQFSSSRISIKFIKAALFYLVISSLGPWGLGPVMATQGKGNLYFLTIFFYLHFLYNGAIIMGLFGMVFKYLEDKGMADSLVLKGERIFLLTNIAVIPTYALSVLWTQPAIGVYWLGGIFALAQLIAWWYFLPFGKLFLTKVKEQNKIAWQLMILVGVSFSLKLFFQLLSSIPFLANSIKALRSSVVMGYMHLVTLGVISFFLIGWFLIVGGFSAKSKLSQVGLFLFVVGAITSEVLLLGQGFLTWNHLGTIPHSTLFLGVTSSLMPVGLGLFAFKR